MRRGRWFLPDEPDVLGELRAQMSLTAEGMDAFAEWAAGRSDHEEVVRDCERRAEKRKRALQEYLREAFVTPVEPEDVYAISRGADWLLNHAKDAIAESEVMQCPPDAALAAMADLLAEAVRHLETAVGSFGAHRRVAAEHAQEAIACERRIEHVYRTGMGDLLHHEDLRDVVARRELYRRCSRIGETAVDVAERILYAQFKES